MTYQLNNNIIPFEVKYFKNEGGHFNSLYLLIWLELIWEICLLVFLKYLIYLFIYIYLLIFTLWPKGMWDLRFPNQD